MIDDGKNPLNSPVSWPNEELNPLAGLQFGERIRGSWVIRIVSTDARRESVCIFVDLEGGNDDVVVEWTERNLVVGKLLHHE